MLPNTKVKSLISKHAELEKELSSGEIDKKNFAEKSKEYSELNEIINEAKEYVLFKKNRDELEKLFKQSPIPSDEIMTQLGLYIRGSYLVKFLVLNDLYLRIKDLPGDIFEFGTRFGHNMVVFENLRAIYEPFNKTRKIIGFDTFEGYKNHSNKDSGSEIFKEDTYYTTFDDYEIYLEKLLKVHEQNNISYAQLHKLLQK